MTVSSKLLFVMGLFKLLISWFDFGGFAKSRNSSISFMFSSLMEKWFIIFQISLLSVVMVLILLI